MVEKRGRSTTNTAALGLDDRQYLQKWIAANGLDVAVGVFHSCQPREFGSIGGMTGDLEAADWTTGLSAESAEDLVGKVERWPLHWQSELLRQLRTDRPTVARKMTYLGLDGPVADDELPDGLSWAVLTNVEDMTDVITTNGLLMDNSIPAGGGEAPLGSVAELLRHCHLLGARVTKDGAHVGLFKDVCAMLLFDCSLLTCCVC